MGDMEGRRIRVERDDPVACIQSSKIMWYFGFTAVIISVAAAYWSGYAQLLLNFLVMYLKGYDLSDRPDFALETAGASIVATNGETFNNGARISLFGWIVCYKNSGPRAIIQPGASPGECWAFKGTSASAVIRLLMTIYIDGVSVEHIPESISPAGSINTAPKEFSIWALSSTDDNHGIMLGRFSYCHTGAPLQYFQIEPRSKPTRFVEVKFHSNHGNPDYTCVYRVKIHGAAINVDGI